MNTDRIIELVQQNTLNHEATTVSNASGLLSINKNQVARELNELCKQAVLFSVQEREIQYFHKATYELINNCALNKSSYINFQELFQRFNQNEKRDFEKLIGFQDSLATCIEQCKAAISYPKNSLPTLLLGATGTGKSYIAQLMYEYAVNHHIIESDKRFVTLNCSEYANNPELLSANLFGHKKGAFTGADKDNLGLIQVANGGVLFLDEVHTLKAECQEKLFLFMDKGIYHKVGENEKWETSEVRFIFATTEKPEEVLLKTFLRRVPITVIIPSLNERGIYERIQVIYEIFMEEESKIERKISISNFVYNMLLGYEFDGNIGEMKNTIKVCCANAITDSSNQDVEIHMKHLPSSMFVKKIESKYTIHNTDERMLNIRDFHLVSNKNRIVELYEKVINWARGRGIGKDDYEKCFGFLKIYYDQIIYDKKEVNDHKSDYILDEIILIVKEEFRRYVIEISNNHLILLFKYIEDVIKNPMWIYNWSKNHRDLTLNLKNDLISRLSREMMIAEEIAQLIDNKLDVKMDEMFISIIGLNMKMMANDMIEKSRIGIIIAHGYSTASSIANAINHLLERNIFESIDMPIDVTTQEILDALNAYLSKLKGYEDLVLLVDMGSLEDLYKGITVESDANIGIINNITTKMALQIGSELVKDTSLDKILKETCESNYFNYRIIEKKKKEDIIVCACVSGIGTAEKIRQLLVTSLPANIPLGIVTYDYNCLVENKGKAELLQKYNVLCVIGTLNPDVDDLLFIPIEDLIINQEIEGIDKLFQRYLTKDEIVDFKKKLLKKFSLTNIMEHLTILNPNKLLEHVATALDHFQQSYRIKIKNSTSVGLYVHTCCMIERLVTHQGFDNYSHLDEMIKNHSDFILCIKQAFTSVEIYYGIEIPLDEIGFMFDYIQNNS